MHTTSMWTRSHQDTEKACFFPWSCSVGREVQGISNGHVLGSPSNVRCQHEGCYGHWGATCIWDVVQGRQRQALHTIQVHTLAPSSANHKQQAQRRAAWV